MTREEAIEIFSGIASLAKINTKPTMSVRNVKNEVFTEVLQALLVPQPAPITGLVKCGCGGEAGFNQRYGSDTETPAERIIRLYRGGMSHVDIAGRGFDLADVRRVISEATAKDETLYPPHRGMQA